MLTLSPALKLVDAGVDRKMPSNDEPSDHAPAWVEVAIAKVQRAKARKSTVASTPDVSLARHNAKRDFAVTAEPSGWWRVRREGARSRRQHQTTPTHCRS